MIQLSDQQRLDWLRLIRSENVGPRTFRALINRYGSAGEALYALPDHAKKVGRLALKIASLSDVEDEMARIHQLGAHLIAMGEKDYPPLLMQTPDAPPLISVRGCVRALQKPMIAIVGSRNASASGMKWTQNFARDLGEAGFIVVSGLARGIDTAAHQVTLQTGTIGVLAGGLDRPYPYQNIPLLEKMLEHGAVISEMPINWEARGRDFPRRNRIVSGVSYGVVVVEAALKSGSLITARFANEQGRDVFAVPGSPLDQRAEGTNDLLKQGATLCTNAYDVIKAVTPQLEREPIPYSLYNLGAFEEEGGTFKNCYWDELDRFDAHITAHQPVLDQAHHARLDVDAAPHEQRQNLINALSMQPTHIDDLARHADVSVRYAQTVLLELELSGQVERHFGGAISLKS